MRAKNIPHTLTAFDRWQEATTWYEKAVDKLKPWYNALSKERQAEVMKLSEAVGKEMERMLDDYVQERADLETLKNAIRRWYKSVKGL